MVTHKKKEHTAFSDDKILLQHHPLLTSDSLQWLYGPLSATFFALLHQHPGGPRGLLRTPEAAEGAPET